MIHANEDCGRGGGAFRGPCEPSAEQRRYQIKLPGGK